MSFRLSFKRSQAVQLESDHCMHLATMRLRKEMKQLSKLSIERHIKSCLERSLNAKIQFAKRLETVICMGPLPNDSNLNM